MKLGIATVITDEGMRSEVLAKTLDDSGFDSIHVTENSHIPGSRTTPYPARGESCRSYDAIVAPTAAALATSKIVIGAEAIHRSASIAAFTGLFRLTDEVSEIRQLKPLPDSGCANIALAQ